jgi:hypothetical protein
MFGGHHGARADDSRLELKMVWQSYLCRQEMRSCRSYKCQIELGIPEKEGGYEGRALVCYASLTW